MINNIQLVECPRDAMQGWKTIIPTDQKIEYINSLLRVGFHTIDFGSFVSHKTIPQMADTARVVRGLRLEGTNTKLLAIVANTRGAAEAVQFDEINYLGFPFSVSPTFQFRNTNSSIEDSVITVEEILELCIKNKKQAVVYISMGFGNPYGDEYSEEIVVNWISKLVGLGVTIISLADTVGLATASQVSSLLGKVIPLQSSTSVGVHLHSTPDNMKSKLAAAIHAGCLRFDGALNGVGGCPMADDELVGNMDTLKMIPVFKEHKMQPQLNEDALRECEILANRIFSSS